MNLTLRIALETVTAAAAAVAMVALSIMAMSAAFIVLDWLGRSLP